MSDFIVHGSFSNNVNSAVLDFFQKLSGEDPSLRLSQQHEISTLKWIKATKYLKRVSFPILFWYFSNMRHWRTSSSNKYSSSTTLEAFGPGHFMEIVLCRISGCLWCTYSTAIEANPPNPRVLLQRFVNNKYKSQNPVRRVNNVHNASRDGLFMVHFIFEWI